MSADVAKNEDRFTRRRVIFDVESEDVVQRNVAFPNPRMPLHFADAKGRMKWWLSGALLEESEGRVPFVLTSSGSRA